MLCCVAHVLRVPGVMMSQGWPPGMARMQLGAGLVRGPQLLLQEESFSALFRRLLVPGLAWTVRGILGIKAQRTDRPVVF